MLLSDSREMDMCEWRNRWNKECEGKRLLAAQEAYEGALLGNGGGGEQL